MASMPVVVGKHYELKMLRKVLILPITFTSSDLGGVSGNGSESVGGSVNHMIGNRAVAAA